MCLKKCFTTFITLCLFGSFNLAIFMKTKSIKNDSKITKIVKIGTKSNLFDFVPHIDPQVKNTVTPFFTIWTIIKPKIVLDGLQGLVPRLNNFYYFLTF